jgi:hypothetical protein
VGQHKLMVFAQQAGNYDTIGLAPPPGASG